MGEWTEMFSNDPDLGIMDQAYNRLKSQSLLIQLLALGILTDIQKIPTFTLLQSLQSVR